MESAYDTLIRASAADLKGGKVDSCLKAVIGQSLGFLQNCAPVELTSTVQSKKYFRFKRGGKNKFSRPVNTDQFDIALAMNHLDKTASADLSGVNEDVRAKVLYTTAISYCCHADLVRDGDKKTPGTFFEIFVGHLVARTFGVNPTTSIEVLNLELTTRLPTDYIFTLGDGKNRIHLPVKTSTRERVIQAWAHQRVLDGVYGVGRFKGVLVALAET